MNKLKRSILRMVSARELDDTFKICLEESFTDFEIIMDLSKTTPFSRTGYQDWLIDFFKKKYPPEEDCPYDLYEVVDRKLQANYDLLHKQICDTLYKIPVLRLVEPKKTL
jgi:hypothetical protein